MLSPLRSGLVAALLIGCHAVSAQTSVPPTVTVQQLAPQLVTFAGSQANFQNLVTGLAQGTQVQLFTVLPDGSTQVVSFTPAPVPVAQIPSLLESTRQQLIGLGIATPTAQQLALALTGGTVPTALGASENRPSPAAQTQSHVTPGSGLNAATGATNAAAAASAEAATRVNTSDSPLAPGATSRTPVAPTPVAPGASAAHSAAPAGVGARSHAR
jgi:hypothetical protein